MAGASFAAGKGFLSASVYPATKAAARVFGLTLAAQLAPRGIGVNIVSPGPVATPIFGRTESTNIRHQSETQRLQHFANLGVPDNLNEW